MTDAAAEQARSRFVEQFAVLLNDAGLQRMPARVFAYVLASDAETHTAAELAAGLRVSPAAISGAVRVLTGIGMLVKDRVPGDRADHYRLYSDDVWATIIGRQEPMFRRVDQLFAEGQTLLPHDRAGYRRIHETREFYRFVSAQLEVAAARWRAHRAALVELRSEPVRARVAPGG
ncbi:MarR family transcriptional regulator [Jiangella ureilytica]|uniref:MarR family transcriptional regulator n=1 Tax=Jiangella ureilytica TaxID=2530374 RepID=A0A4R4RPR0_9ACTN|nr:MarR family transcriptional regulator [Jiangella ureilytica]TDC51484.1 MarR family transcriptional regulator [Jiangella ureilytica]